MERADLEQWKAREVARLLALVETERRYYQEIVANVPLGLLVVSRDLTIVSANRAFRETFGVKSQDLLRRNLDEVLPIDGLDVEIGEVLANGNSKINRFYQLSNDAGIRTLRVSIQKIRSWNDDGDEEVLVSVEDFGNIHGLYSATIEASAEPVVELPPPPDPREGLPVIAWEADPASFHFLYVNRAAEQILGYPLQEWLADARFWTRRIHPDDRDWMEKFYHSAVELDGSRRCEYRAVRADGRVIWLRDIFAVDRGDGERPAKLAGVTLDVTDRRRVEEQVLEAHKFEALSRVAGKAAHGFNNLLMIIGGYGDELLEGLSPDSPLRADIEEILRATERVTSISGQLMAFSRRPAPQPKEIDLSEMVGRLEAPLRSELPAKIDVSVQGGGEIKVKADPNHLGQVIHTLAQSAVQSMPGGGKLRIEAGIVSLGDDYAFADSALRPGPHAMITISDTGAGLDAESRRRMFEPSFVASDVTIPKMTTANAYGLVRQNGGDIIVESSLHQGTTVRILFPLVGELPKIPATAAAAETAAPPKEEPKPEPEPEPPHPPKVEKSPAPVQPVAPPPPPAPARAKPTVLVVEDEAGIRMLMRKILDRNGYQVIEAKSGEEALRIVREQQTPIQLLVTDIVMPQMNGRELADRVVPMLPGVKVLFVSGYTDDQAIRSGDFGPGSGFLQKPFTLGSLIDKVHEVLGEAKVQ